MIDPNKLKSIKSIAEFVSAYKDCSFCGLERELTLTDYDDDKSYTYDAKNTIFFANNGVLDIPLSAIVNKKKTTMTVFARCYDNDDHHEMEASMTQLHNGALYPFQDTLSFRSPNCSIGVIAEDREINEPLQIVLETYKETSSLAIPIQLPISKKTLLDIVSDKETCQEKLEKILLLRN